MWHSGLWRTRLVCAVAKLAILLLPSVVCASSDDTQIWTERERRILDSMTLRNAGPPPDDPSNAYATSEAAAKLGQQLFFDKRLSGNGEIACSTCHVPQMYFTDGRARSKGANEVMRNSPTVVGAAYQRWFYWDGRRDSLWAQATIPFEASDEMDGSRVAVVRTVLTDAETRKSYEAIFGTVSEEIPFDELPEHAGPFGGPDLRNAWFRLPNDTKDAVNRVYSNLAKAIAAYERTLVPPETRFDRYVYALNAGRSPEPGAELTEDEIAGAKLFMNAEKTQCLQCHNGPMLTNGDFHNIGTGNFSGPNLDYGRVFGLRAVLMDVFNCLGPYSDAEPAECDDLRFLNKDSHVPLEGAFKVPGLRALGHTAPYFHDGRFNSLNEVLEFYNSPPDPQESGPHELRSLDLSVTEMAQLERFLLTLSH